MILQSFPLTTTPWPTVDPFLFCVYHLDHYPASDSELGLEQTSLKGRSLGSDFSGKDGWSMYHGTAVPGFPQHPHRGFETVTVTRQGFIDHADSMRAAARYGQGDVQWLTAGAGVVHAEMFPLLHHSEPNPAELFQLWLNLPRANKMVEPHFTMFWKEDVPVVQFVNTHGAISTVTVVAGTFGDTKALPPPPNSYAASAESDVAIWTIRLASGSDVTLPPSGPDSVRILYVFGNGSVTIDSESIETRHGAIVDSIREHTIRASDSTEVLVLQGRPIGEPVAQYGPFVMNDRAGIEQAYADYQRTQFGGWPWPSDGPTHGPTPARFARRPNGALELPPGGAPVG